MAVCNTTLEDEFINEIPMAMGMTFHNIALIVSAVFTVISSLLSFYLIFMHATHYSKPYEQKHIIRILFMIPIYSIISFLSFLYYRHAIYFQVVRDSYEAFAIASFFTLLCHYVAPNLHDQKEYFRGVRPKEWVWPINWFKRCTGGEHGLFRTPRSGLTWFNVMFAGVFQYCLIRVLMTFISVITQAAGRYCAASLHPSFAHVWAMVFEATAVTIAMYCLIQFYVQLKDDLAHHRPLLKILCIKLVIFFSFWQTIAASFLTSAGVLKPSEKINYSDYKVGIPSMLLCIEMAIFSVMHLFAFPYAEYRLSQVASDSDGNTIYQGGFLGWNAYVNAYNPWDIVKAVGRSFRWLFVGRRRRLEDSSYKDHMDGVGLEPTRTRSEYVGAAPTPDHAAGVHLPMKKAKYQRLDEHDDGRYVSQTQPRPSHGGVAYDAPVLGRFESAHVGDRGEHRRWESEPEPDRLTTWHPGPATVDSRRQQRSEPGYGSLVRDEAAWGGGEKGRPGLR